MNAPTRVKNPLAAWKVALATLLAGGTLAILHALLLSLELQQRQPPQPPQPLLPLLGYVVCTWLPLILASCAMALAFGRWRDTLLLPRNLALLLLGATVLMLPLMEIVAVLVELDWAKAPLNSFSSSFSAEFVRRGRFAWWTDGCSLLFALGAQAAVAAWQQAQAQALAWQQEQSEQLQLRLRLLQGQLKPHFLFNALNSISALVRSAEREPACHAVNQLRELLRYVVHAGDQEWLSVADELAFVRHYLDMQMLRYGERLTLDWRIGQADWAQMACPPLLFQPLLENAIHHGIEIHHERCLIRIELALESGALRFCVHNPVVAGALPRQSQGHGIGLSAIRGRIAILYGELAQLLTVLEADYFCATLHMPARPLPPAGNPD